MKTASVKIPECLLLLVLSIICPGNFLLSPLTSQAQPPLPASHAEPNTGLVAIPRPATITTRGGQADKSPPQVVGRFTIEAGKSRRDSLTIGHKCPAPNLIRIKSGQRILQFEGPTDAVSFRPGLNNFSVRIDAAKLKPKLYPVKFTVECLDCKPPTCFLKIKELVVEITVVKPSSPAKPSQGKLPAGGSAASPADDKEARVLSKRGPQFPDKYNLSDFSFKAFVRGGWPFFIDYELEQPGRLTLTIAAKNAPPFTYEFKETSVGRHNEKIKLPASLGSGPASYTIKAVSERSANGVLVPLIWALAAGDGAVGSSEIDQITLSPRDIRIIRGKPAKASYSFRARVPFSGGAQADIRLLDGGSSEQVSSKFYGRHLTAGDVISDEWNCKKGGQPSLGRHELFVKAWYTIEEGDGAFGIAISLPVVVR
jgi:hypothetical protein